MYLESLSAVAGSVAGRRRMADKRVRAALQLLQEAGSLDLVRKAVVEHLRPARRAASSVGGAVLACLPQRRMKT
ncbi:hypothetical protein NDU88_001657 [Pleurodeles waltl]|uniref:Uncharacterized protein n=1 Tax=Pleurodeles waltl TaxID=8319 RepID=A0AAV7SBI2_PLEWA|nr:hypothetical protein NDU88_001657 [Pleurodeles waltl]